MAGARNVLWQIKKEAERFEMETCWRDPFYDRIHPDEKPTLEATSLRGNTLYLPNPPIPRITPFDFACLSVTLEELITFKLSFYYWKILQGKVDVEEISEVFDKHTTDWSLKMAEYFNDIASEFSLRWDSEYDDYIEDSLYGFFTIEQVGSLVSLMNMVCGEKEKFLKEA